MEREKPRLADDYEDREDTVVWWSAAAAAAALLLLLGLAIFALSVVAQSHASPLPRSITWSDIEDPLPRVVG